MIVARRRSVSERMPRGGAVPPSDVHGDDRPQRSGGSDGFRAELSFWREGRRERRTDRANRDRLTTFGGAVARKAKAEKSALGGKLYLQRFPESVRS
jgi:hypothetical protein